MGFVRDSMRGRADRPPPGPFDRRRSCRYRVLLGDVLLGWWEGSTFVKVPAHMLDLSLQGCMLEMRRAPARTARQPVWVRSLVASSQEWTEGVVLAVRKPLIKRCRIRIAFRDSFPYQTFKKLVYGAEDFHGSSRHEPAPHEQDHYWK
jgi:hypothetical protein